MPGVEEEHETQIETKGNGDFNPIKRKVVAIGDSACGKTNLLLAFRENRFRDDYIPTVFENTLVTVPVEHRIVELIFWDTAGMFVSLKKKII